MEQEKQSTVKRKQIDVWKEKKVIKWVRKKALKMAILISAWSLIKTCLSSQAFQSFTHFIATVLAGSLTVQLVDNSLTVRWGFLIPFAIIYLTLLVLFNIMNQRKTKQVTDNALLERINKSVYELSVMRHTLYVGSNPETIDIIAQNTCKAVHDIICDYFLVDSIKVTTVKLCSGETQVKMNGLYPGEGQNPSLYGVSLSIKGKHNPNTMSFVEIFRDNKEEGLILKTEEEVLAKLAPHGKHPIHTKQLISIPGFANNRVVVLLQIASKKKDLFSEEDFLFIAERITPVFIQILTNTHMIDSKRSAHTK